MNKTVQLTLSAGCGHNFQTTKLDCLTFKWSHIPPIGVLRHGCVASTLALIYRPGVEISSWHVRRHTFGEN